MLDSVRTWSTMRRSYRRPSLAHPALSDPVIKSLAALVHTRTTVASDPTDKTYAVLALFDPEDRKAIVVDYSPSNTAQRLHIRVAEHFVTKGDAMVLLEQAGTRRMLSDIPSWVPYWFFKPTRLSFESQLYCCATSKIPEVTVHSNTMRLYVSGAIIDSVKNSGTAFSRCSLVLPGGYPNGDYVRNVIWRTKLFDAIYRGGRIHGIGRTCTEYPPVSKG